MFSLPLLMAVPGQFARFQLVGQGWIYARISEKSLAILGAC